MDIDPVAQALQAARKRIGRTGATLVRKIEAGALEKFARAIGDSCATIDGDEGPIAVAPPTYLSTFAFDTITGLVEDDLPFDMMLHTDDSIEVGVPICAGDTITAVARYADAFIREGRTGPMLFQQVDMSLTNGLDQHVATVRISVVNFNSKAQGV